MTVVFVRCLILTLLKMASLQYLHAKKNGKFNNNFYKKNSHYRYLRRNRCLFWGKSKNNPILTKNNDTNGLNGSMNTL